MIARSLPNIFQLPEKFLAYYELCKPRVVALMLLTAIVGMFLATPGFVDWRILIFGNLGIGLSAAAAAVVNHWVDQRIDSIMKRTESRPLPTGRINSREALVFAGILGILGTVILIFLVNPLTALLTVMTLMGYAVVYTMYLKRATPQNIVIGGAAGAAPPLLGWVAVTNTIDPQALLLVLIIFVWTPPHFWALAIHRAQDYARAEIPMLPVTHGIGFTKLNVLLYTFLLIAATLLPYAIGMSGAIYFYGTLILNAVFLYYALRLWLDKGTKWAMPTFGYSIIYLLLLFIVLLIDHYWFI